jgi:hypothetical protein
MEQPLSHPTISYKIGQEIDGKLAIFSYITTRLVSLNFASRLKD